MTTQLDANTTRRGVIVAGIDFSATSDRAVAASFTLVREDPGTDVHLVHVALPRGASRDDAGPYPDLTQLNELLQSVARRYFTSTRTGRPRIFTHLLEGSPPREIVQLATDLHAGLIVIGTNGQSSRTRLTLGSVADRVLRVANCSVLAVRPNGLPLSQEIDPPCQACLDVQRSTHRADLWCERHAKKHANSRAYFDDPQMYHAGSTAFRHN